MLILSQDKETIYNFDNIIELKTISGGYNYDCYIGSYNIDGSSTTMGVYNTEERAKEILQEIIEKYKEENYAMIESMAKAQLVYEMPEK